MQNLAGRDVRPSFADSQASPSFAGLQQGVALGETGLAQADVGVDVFCLLQGRIVIRLDRLQAVRADAFLLRLSGELGVCIGLLAAHNATSRNPQDGINAVSLDSIGDLRATYHLRGSVFTAGKGLVCDRRHVAERQISHHEQTGVAKKSVARVQDIKGASVAICQPAQ